jgi:hypothetical protein
MSKKTLKIKRIFAYTIYNNLRSIPPKDYPSTGEIKSTISVVLPALKEHISKFLEIFKKAEDLSIKVKQNKISEADSKIEVDKYNEEWKNYNLEHGNEIVDISLDEESFKILKTQFDRDNWGKKWVMNIEEFGELVDAFEEAGK